jgi:hypothetical protein
MSTRVKVPELKFCDFQDLHTRDGEGKVIARYDAKTMGGSMGEHVPPALRHGRNSPPRHRPRAGTDLPQGPRRGIREGGGMTKPTTEMTPEEYEEFLHEGCQHPYCLWFPEDWDEIDQTKENA